MGIEQLLLTLLVSLGFNLLMFVPAFYLKTDKLTDFSYALSFLALSLYTLLTNESSPSKLLLFAMISLWALRLGSYLAIRIQRMGKDTRFDEMRNHFWSFLSFWILQGLSVWLILIPSLLFFGSHSKEIHPPALIGVGLWALGLSIESIADHQKFRFKSNPINKGAWIESGLWKYSRHPNYFGEILLWFGIYIYCVFGLQPLENLLGTIGPLTITTLILFISGLPPLEKKADKRWPNNQAYQAYKKRTSILIPLPNSKV